MSKMDATRYKAINPRYDTTLTAARLLMAKLIAMRFAVSGIFCLPQGGGTIGGAMQIDAIPEAVLVQEGLGAETPIFLCFSFFGSPDLHPVALIAETLENGDMLAYARVFGMVKPGDTTGAWMSQALSVPEVKAALEAAIKG